MVVMQEVLSVFHVQEFNLVNFLLNQLFDFSGVILQDFLLFYVMTAKAGAKERMCL